MMVSPHARSVAERPCSFDEMPPLLLSDALRKVGCAASGQLTPPPSPVDGCQPRVRPRTIPRLQMINLLSRRNGTLKKSKDSVFVQSHSHSQTRCSTSQTVSPTMVDPGVPQDSLHQDHMVVPEQSGDGSSTISAPALELRRITDTYADLRTIAQDQQPDHHITLPDITPHHTPLLPSPIIDEHMMDFHQYDSSPFKFTNPRHIGHSRKESNYKSYDEMEILSCYEDTAESPNASRLDELLEIKDIHTNTASSEQRATDAQTPTRCKELIPPSSGQSSGSLEADWLANTSSHQQRLRKFNTRYYQVIQRRSQKNASMADEEGQVMVATVLVGPGKPKLVQIQRPTSSHYSNHSNCDSNYSEQSLESEIRDMNTPPSTPTHQDKEISAFSPYDTPSVVTPFTDISNSARTINSVLVEQNILTLNELDLVPPPLSTSRQGSASSYETVLSTTENRLEGTGRNFSLPVTPYRQQIPTSSTTTTTYVPGDAFKSGPKQKKRVSFGITRTDIDANLLAITMAIQEFPNTILGLDSSIVYGIRKQPNINKDKLHLDTLSKIFTNAPKQLLELLAAWILVDLYVCSIPTDQPESQPRRVSSPVISPPPKSFVSRRTASFGSAKPQRAIYRLFPLPPTRIFRSSPSPPLDEPHMEPELSSIPTKARSILGLCNDDMSHFDQQALTTCVKDLSVSLGVIAQKLMETLRGEGGLDMELWKALKIVISITEDTVMDASALEE